MGKSSINILYKAGEKTLHLTGEIFCQKFFKKHLTNAKLSAIILHVPFTTTLLVRMCWCGSMAEQLICNQQVDGSTPFTSSKYGGFPERPKGADCKSVVTDFGGSNPPSSTNLNLICGCSSMVEFRPSKPAVRVRSPSPAPDYYNVGA